MNQQKPRPGHDLFANLRAISRGHNWTGAVQLLEQALAKTHPVSERSYGTAISACDRASLWQQALRFLAHANVPNLILWNATISACSRARRWTTACALLEQMLRTKLWPDVITFNSTMRAFAGTGSSTSRWQAACLLYQQIRESRLHPSIQSISTVTCLCGQGNAWHAALAFLNDATEGSVPIDAACYSLARYWFLVHVVDDGSAACKFSGSLQIKSHLTWSASTPLSVLVSEEVTG